MKIETSRLMIRNLKSSDLQDFYVYRSNPEVTKYQGFDVMDMDSASRFIESQKDRVFGVPEEWIQLGIEKKSSGKIVGDCAVKINGHENSQAEIGITISHLEQKNGYAKEVMTGLLNYLFASANMLRVVETVDAENIASIQLLRSIGFRQEGHFIENIFFKGAWGSEYQFAMLKREWEQIQSKKQN